MTECTGRGCVTFHRRIICGTQYARVGPGGNLEVISTEVDHADDWQCEDCGRPFADRLRPGEIDPEDKREGEPCEDL